MWEWMLLKHILLKRNVYGKKKIEYIKRYVQWNDVVKKVVREKQRVYEKWLKDRNARPNGRHKDK